MKFIFTQFKFFCLYHEEKNIGKFVEVLISRPTKSSLYSSGAEHIKKNFSDHAYTDTLSNFRDYFNYAHITSLDAEWLFSL